MVRFRVLKYNIWYITLQYLRLLHMPPYACLYILLVRPETLLDFGILWNLIDSMYTVCGDTDINNTMYIFDICITTFDTAIDNSEQHGETTNAK